MAFAALPGQAFAQSISTLAGTGTYSNTLNGDGGQATAASVGSLRAIAYDASGNLYFSENYAVRKISTTGVLTTIAGGNTPGSTGDGGLATSALLDNIKAIAIDSVGNIYISIGNKIRKVTVSTGIISAFAGTSSGCGTNIFSGRTNANVDFCNVNGMVFDASNNLFVADNFRNASIIRLAASGNSVASFGTSPQCINVTDVRIDSSGNVIAICIGGLRKYNSGGGYVTDPTTPASPVALAADASNNIYISSANHTVHRLDAGGNLSTVVGTGVAGFSGDGGAATAAQLNGPFGLAVHPANLLTIADVNNNRIRRYLGIAPAAPTIVSAVGGLNQATVTFNPPVPNGGPAVSGYTATCGGVSVSGSASPIVVPLIVNASVACNVVATNLSGTSPTSATLNAQVYTYLIHTIAGNGTAGFSGDGGQALSALVNGSLSIIADPAGNLLFTDSTNNRVRKITPAGVISTFAGTGTAGWSGDSGQATAAALNAPFGLGIDAAGNVYVADSGNNRVRKITPAGVITTVAGDGTDAAGGDGGQATAAQLGSISGLAFDAAGNLYITQRFYNRVRKVTPAGMISTIAGTGVAGSSGDNGQATSAQLYFPIAVAVSTAGEILIAELYGHRVRRITTAGVISTIAGTGVAGFSGDNGQATAAQLNYPAGVYVSPTGEIYIPDRLNYRLRKVAANGVITTVAGNGSVGTPGDGGPALTANINEPSFIAFDADGNLYIPERSGARVRKVTMAAPAAPTIGSATGGNGQVTVSFTPAPTNGGAPVTGFTATCGTVSTSGAASPIVVTGMADTPAVTCTVRATNYLGASVASAASNSAVVGTVPGAPTIGTATRGNGLVNVFFSAPGSSGSSAITSYTATCGAATNSGVTSPVVVSGLANGSAVTCTVRATNNSGQSAASGVSNSVTPATVPDAPTIGTATGGNAQVSVVFTPAGNGGTAITGYTATCGAMSNTGASSPILVTGLTNGVAVTCSVVAVNSVGTGAASVASNSVTPSTVPTAPVIGTATAGIAQVSVTFAPPANNGGSTITSYTATCGANSNSGAASPIVVSGLANAPVTCTVRATNIVGTSAASAASNSATPLTTPDAPTNVNATAGNGRITVSFTPPLANGGNSITGYTATCGAASNSAAASPIVVTAFNGVSATCNVIAANVNGNSAASAPSNSVVASPTWRAAGTLSGPRSAHVAVLLNDGSVLAIGGTNNGTLDTVDRYNPATNNWSAMAAMPVGRYFHTATVLNDGRVFVAGGISPANAVLNTTVLYDPVTNVWTAGPNLLQGRYGHLDARLPSGKVLIAAGNAYPELYDPATNSMSATGNTPLAVTGGFGSLTVLANGQALIVGGVSGATAFSATALYNPATNTWSASGNLNVGRYSHQVARLADGNVMVVGGHTVGNSSLNGTLSAEIYNVSSGTWQTVAAMPAPLRNDSRMVSLPSGELLQVGGSDVNTSTPYNSTLTYNTATNNWTDGSILIGARTGLSATSIGNGKVLISGGRGAGGQAILTAEIRDADYATVPGAPVIGGVAGSNGAVTVTFTLPSGDGGSPTTAYNATCGAQSNTGTASPIAVSGLTNGAGVTCTVTASNAFGMSSASTASASVTPATVPDAPIIGTATAGAGSVSVSFTAPLANGGSVITGYIATCGSQSNTGSAPPIVVSGLTNGSAVTCVVVASNAAGNSVASATSNSVTPQGTQSISFGAAPTIAVGGSGSVTAFGGASGNPVTFTSLTPLVCSISGALVTGATAGTCTIAADQAGNASYTAAAQATQNITVGAGTQTIVFGAAPTVIVGGSGSVSANGGASNNTILFTSSTPGICSISGNVVTGVTVGTCTIAANQSGDTNYQAAAQVTQSFSIGIATQTIVFGAAPTVVVGGSGMVSASGGASNNPVTFTSTTTGTCTVVGSTVTGVSTGTCTIAANQTGNANYTAAPQITQNIIIGVAAQTITFGTAPSIAVGGNGMVSATGGLSGNAVTFTSNTSAVCTVAGNVVTGITAGSCIIAANQSGNANYSVAAQVTQTFSIGTGSQTITFGIAPTLAVGGTGMVSATGGLSGNAVTFTSNTPTICTVSGNVVTGLAVGTCTVAANQPGNANYNAAPVVTQNIIVTVTNYTVTPTAGSNGTINPAVPQTVNSGATFVFTVIPNNGYTAAVTGTCGGSLVGTSYTTNAITANCSVIASFTATATSTTTLASNLNPSNFGQSVTFTATVSGGVGTPTGSVEFRDGGNVIAGCSAVPLSGGIAQCVTSAIPAGTRSITAQYAGNATYGASTSAVLMQTVIPGKVPLQAILFFLMDD